MKQLSKLISIILAGVAAGCLLGAGILYLDGRKDDIQSEQLLDTFRTMAQEESEQAQEDHSGSSDTSTEPPYTQEITAQADSSSTVSDYAESTETTEELPAVVNPYADSYLANDDMAAWLKIPDTVIDYPVMWTPKDENYYLYRSFDKKENKNASSTRDVPIMIFDDSLSAVDSETDSLIRKALKEQEVPIGSVVVCGERVIGRGHNLVETLCDATAHAEMQSITAAAATLGGKYL